MERRTKRGRTVRGKPRSKLLQQRDFELLEFLAVVRYALPRQAAYAVGIPSIDRARRVLRRLYDLRAIAVTMTASTSPNLIGLTREGLDHVRTSSPELAARARLGGIRLAEVERHLLLVDARLYAAAFGLARGAALVRFATSAGLGKELGFQGLDPDGLAQFAASAGTVAILIETDVSRGSAHSILRRLDRYQALARSARADALWIPTTGTGRRVHELVERLKKLRLDEWARVLTMDELLRRPVCTRASRDGTPFGSATRRLEAEIADRTESDEDGTTPEVPVVGT